MDFRERDSPRPGCSWHRPVAFGPLWVGAEGWGLGRWAAPCVGQALTFAEDAGSGVGCERREGTRWEAGSGSRRAGRPVGEDPGVEGPLCRAPPSPDGPGCGQGVGSGSAHVMIRALDCKPGWRPQPGAFIKSCL